MKGLFSEFYGISQKKPVNLITLSYAAFASGWAEVNTVFWLTTYLSSWEFCRSGPAAGQRIYWPRDSVREKTNKQTNTLAQILRNPFFLNFHAYYSRRKKNWRHCLRLHNFVWGRKEMRGQTSSIMKHVKIIQRVRFSLCVHFGLGSGMIFEGTAEGVYERVYGFNSKWVRMNSKWILRSRFWWHNFLEARSENGWAC